MNDAFDQHFLPADIMDQRTVICKFLTILARGRISTNGMKPLWGITDRNKRPREMTIVIL